MKLVYYTIDTLHNLISIIFYHSVFYFPTISNLQSDTGSERYDNWKHHKDWSQSLSPICNFSMSTSDLLNSFSALWNSISDKCKSNSVLWNWISYYWNSISALCNSISNEWSSFLDFRNSILCWWNSNLNFRKSTSD